MKVIVHLPAIKGNNLRHNSVVFDSLVATSLYPKMATNEPSLPAYMAFCGPFLLNLGWSYDLILTNKMWWKQCSGMAELGHKKQFLSLLDVPFGSIPPGNSADSWYQLSWGCSHRTSDPAAVWLQVCKRPPVTTTQVSNQSTAPWEIIINRCFQPLSFGVVCYTAIDNQNKFVL